MNIYDVVKGKGTEVFTVKKDDVVLETLKMLNEKHIGALMVMENDTAIGIISERDILKFIYSTKNNICNEKISKIMTPADKFIAADTNDSLHKVMKMMSDNKVRHIPIFDESKLVGIVSIGDLIHEILKLSETENQQMKQYVMGNYPN